MIMTNRSLINECWQKIHECKHLPELLEAVSGMPPASGAWTVNIPEEDSNVLVTVRHDYYEDAFGCMDFEEERFTLVEDSETSEIRLITI